MKKHKMIITLVGLVATVATTATVAAYTLAGDGSSPPANETAGTQEPAFPGGMPSTFDAAPDTIYDGKGGVYVTNPDVDGAAGGTVLAGQGIKWDDTPVGKVVPDKGDPQFASGTVLQMDTFLATGAEVEVTGEVVSEGIFSVDGTIILVNGEQVQVMEYRDAAALEAEAAGISPSGSSVATPGHASMVTWVAPPHFFRTDTAIVLYMGDNSKVIEALTSVLGPQFAGR